jgi:hypothetical protein
MNNVTVLRPKLYQDPGRAWRLGRGECAVARVPVAPSERGRRKHDLSASRARRCCAPAVYSTGHWDARAYRPAPARPRTSRTRHARVASEEPSLALRARRALPSAVGERRPSEQAGGDACAPRNGHPCPVRSRARFPRADLRESTSHAATDSWNRPLVALTPDPDTEWAAGDVRPAGSREVAPRACNLQQLISRWPCPI